MFSSDGETLTHLLKASLGTGILAMPQAFMCAGLITGIFATVFVSAVCTFCSYLLVSITNAHIHHVLPYHRFKTIHPLVDLRKSDCRDCHSSEFKKKLFEK